MKKSFKWLLVSGVVLFYAFLYMATSKKCDDECQKLKKVGTELRKDSAVNNTYQCGTAMLCIYVADSTGRNWNAFADMACQHLNNEGLQNYSVIIVEGINRDTLAKKICP